MREYKFRAWDSRQKKMCFDVNVYSDSDGTWWAADWYGEDLHQISSFDSNQDGSEIMQFIGIKDKNGKEIFEGDVVVYKNERYIVKYFNRVGSFRLYPIFLNNESHNGSLSWSKRFRDSVSFSSLYEIIGNIHEHPELLK